MVVVLACLLLSGLLSWFNFMGICWRLRPASAWRAGHETLVTVEDMAKLAERVTGSVSQFRLS